MTRSWIAAILVVSLFSGGCGGDGSVFGTTSGTPAPPTTAFPDTTVPAGSSAPSTTGPPETTTTVPAVRPEGNVAWSMEFDEVFSGVARGGVLYLGVTNDVTDDTELWAIEGATGEVRWATSIGSDYPNPVLADDGTVIVTTAGSVVGLAAESGAERWRFERPLGTYFGHSETQIVDDFAIVHDLEEEAVLALGVTDGAMLWEAPETSLLAVFGDWVLVWGDEEGGDVRALGLRDGRRLWSQPYVGLDWELHVPVLSEGVLIVGDRESVRALDAETGAEVWTTLLSDCCVMATIVEGDAVYVASDEQTVTALRRTDGAVLWETNTGLDLDLYRTDGTPLVALADVVVVGGEEEHEIIGLSPDSGATVWRLSTQADYFSPFIVSSGILYANDAQGIGYAIDATSGTALWSVTTEEDLSIEFIRPVLDQGILYLFGWGGVAAVR
jgi:outer membrane protein assembly factor BamB